MGRTTLPIARTASRSLLSGVARTVLGATVPLVAPGKSSASTAQTVPGSGRVPFRKYVRRAPCVQREGAKMDVCWGQLDQCLN
jgi:hypothetical protein